MSKQNREILSHVRERDRGGKEREGGERGGKERRQREGKREGEGEGEREREREGGESITIERKNITVEFLVLYGKQDIKAYFRP